MMVCLRSTHKRLTVVPKGEPLFVFEDENHISQTLNRRRSTNNSGSANKKNLVANLHFSPGDIVVVSIDGTLGGAKSSASVNKRGQRVQMSIIKGRISSVIDNTIFLKCNDISDKTRLTRVFKSWASLDDSPTPVFFRIDRGEQAKRVASDN